MLIKGWLWEPSKYLYDAKRYYTFWCRDKKLLWKMNLPEIFNFFLLHFLPLEDSNGRKIPSTISHYLTQERFLPDLLDADLGFAIGFIPCRAFGGPLPSCVTALRSGCHSVLPNTADCFSGMSLSGLPEWALQSSEGIKKRIGDNQEEKQRAYF